MEERTWQLKDFQVVHWAQFTYVEKNDQPVYRSPFMTAMCYASEEPYTCVLMFSPTLIWEISRDVLDAARWDRVGSTPALLYPLRRTNRRGKPTKMAMQLTGIDIATLEPAHTIITVGMPDVDYYLSQTYDHVPKGLESQFFEPTLDRTLLNILNGNL